MQCVHIKIRTTVLHIVDVNHVIGLESFSFGYASPMRKSNVFTCEIDGAPNCFDSLHLVSMNYSAVFLQVRDVDHTVRLPLGTVLALKC